MKKILAVLIAISMVATMAFAADVSFSVDFAAKGNLVKVSDLSDAKNSTTILNETQDTADAWAPPMWGGTGYDFNVSASTDDGKAGASISIYNDAGHTYGTSLWIKPIDMLKLSFFSADEKLFAESVSGADILKTEGDYGVTLTPVAGLTADVVIGKDIKLEGTPTIGAKVTYAIDGVGTIVANGNLAKQFGAGITGVAVGPVSGEAYFIYDAGTMNAYENATVAAGPVKVFEEVKLDDLTGTLVIPTYVKVSGKAGDVALACAAQWADVKEVAKLSVTPSATISGKVGAAGWSLGAKVPVAIDDDVTVGVQLPYTVTLSF